MTVFEFVDVSYPEYSDDASESVSLPPSSSLFSRKSDSNPVPVPSLNGLEAINTFFYSINCFKRLILLLNGNGVLPCYPHTGLVQWPRDAFLKLRLVESSRFYSDAEAFVEQRGKMLTLETTATESPHRLHNHLIVYKLV